MWNVVGPFEVGNPADWAVVSGAVQSQNHRCLCLAEEVSVAQIEAIVADSVVVEGEGGTVDGVEVSVAVGAAVSVADGTIMGVVDVVAGTEAADFGVYCVPHVLAVVDRLFQVVVGVGVSDTRAEEASVSTQTVDLEDHQTDLVGMALRAVGTGVGTGAAAGLVHLEVAVGMEVGTVPTLNGRAQGWTRIAIQSDQGIEPALSDVLPWPHYGVSLPEYFPLINFLSIVTLLSLPPTCCVSIQCCLGCSTNVLAANPSQDSWNYHIIMIF